MDKTFYQLSIEEDRRTRCFLDFSDEAWFKEFLALSNPLLIEKRKLGEYFSGQRKINISIIAYNKLKNILNIFKYAFPELSNIPIGKLSFSQELLDKLISIDSCFLLALLHTLKPWSFGNDDDTNKEFFPKINLPLIRMMDYFLDKGAFKHLACTMHFLEFSYIALWFEITQTKIDEVIAQNLHNPDIFYIFSQMDKHAIKQFLKKDYFYLIENMPAIAIYSLLQHTTLPEEYLRNEFLQRAFKKFSLEEQILILDLMEKREYPSTFTSQLRILLNKSTSYESKEDFVFNTFQLTPEKVNRLLDEIKSSSYFAKNNIAESGIWKRIMLAWENVVKEFNPNMPISDCYSELTDLHKKCKDYATISIVNSFYPLSMCTKPVTHIYDEPYCILVRVDNVMDQQRLEQKFEGKPFHDFSILTPKNMSHYATGVIYGYYSNVSANLIAHICAIDSLSRATAIFECDLSSKSNSLLDIEDLNEATLREETYNNLCIRSKCNDGSILWPDCIVCIDKIDKNSQTAADSLGLNIVVIHKSAETIENNEDIYAHLK